MKNNCEINKTRGRMEERSANQEYGQIKRFSSFLESLIMVPFRKLNFFSANQIIPVLPEKIKLTIDQNRCTTTKYIIEVEYGRHKWTVHQNIIEIFSLRTHLYFCGIKEITETSINLQSDVCVDNVAIFLRHVLWVGRLYDLAAIYDFFRISKYSFAGDKLLEDKFYVEIIPKRSTGWCPILGCNNISGYFKKTYLVCKNNFIIFIDYKSNYEVKFLLFYTGQLEVKMKKYPFLSQIHILNVNKSITIQSFDHQRVQRLYEEITRAEEQAQINRKYASFAPIRDESIVNFFVDGKSYFERVYNSLILARKEIFIAGWWIYPTLYLKRKMVNGKLDKRYRLDTILKMKAREGVKIKVLLFKEVEISLPINSLYTLKVFAGLDKNIEVLRHPNILQDGILYWSHHEKLVVIDQKTAFLGGIDLALGRYDTQEHSLFDQKTANPRSEVLQQKKKELDRRSGLEAVIGAVEGANTTPLNEGIHWPGMDFSNPLKKDFKDVEFSHRSLIDRNVTPRMPWHDVQCMITGGSAFDVARFFIERWNMAIGDAESISGNGLIIPDDTIISKSHITKMDASSNAGTGLKTQVVRSVGMWSVKLPVEKSIFTAYTDLIDTSKRFIYIENQFFITNCNESVSSEISNTVGSKLVEWIARAHRNGEEFKIYVFVPLLPAFEVNFASDTSSSVCRIIQAQMESISKGPASIHGALKALGINPDEYIMFLALRKAYFDGERLATEQIYVHSKLMIVDGERALIGSANLNDRSLLGERDSEIGLVVNEGSEKCVSKLLKNLLQEHLGVCRPKKFTKAAKYLYCETNLTGYISSLFKNDNWMALEKDSIFAAISKRAAINTKLFRELFRPLPDDNVRTIQDYAVYMQGKCFEETHRTPAILRKILKRIKGHVIQFPCKFLADENFNQGLLSLSNLIPAEIFF